MVERAGKAHLQRRTEPPEVAFFFQLDAAGSPKVRSPLKVLVQVGLNGCVPVPSEKRLFIGHILRYIMDVAQFF